MTEPVHTDPPPIDYTSRDYRNIRSDGINMIPYFLSTWTDHNQSDPGVALIGLFAAMEDRLNYYVDRSVDQSSLTTALTRDRVITHGRTLNYTHSGPEASTVDVTVVATGASANAAYTIQLTSSTGEIFENSAAINFAGAGTLTAQPFIHGQSIDDNPLLISDGRANQTNTFTASSVLDTPITVSVGGVAWTQVEALTIYTSSDQVYYLQRNDNDTISFHFGDGVHGQIPPIGSAIRTQYRVGGGVAGQIELGGINQTIGVLTFTNPAGSVGGGPSETIDDIRVNAPRNWASQERCVTEEDYATKALLVSGASKAKAYPRFTNIVQVYVAPNGGGTATAALLTSVTNYLTATTRQMATDSVEALSATYVNIRISGIVYVLPTYANATVEAATDANVTSLMAFANRDLGENEDATGNVKFSDLVAAIDNTTGVDSVNLDEFRIVSDVDYVTWSNPAVTVNTIGINDETIAETWEVQFTTTTQFLITGSISGPQVTLGTLGTAYTSDDDRISFTVSGAAVMVVGDKATFRVSRFIAIDDIIVNRGEIAQIATSGLNLTYTGGTL
jgi:hypothetical protein